MRRTLAIALAGALALWADAALAEAYRLGPESPPSPRRVVTLGPSLTELVVELGAGARLVGVSRFDDAEAVRAVRRVGGLVDPSPEAILRLRPDLLLVTPGVGDRATIERLAALGVPVLVVPLESLQDILAAIDHVAQALGVVERGAKLRAAIEARIAAVRARAAGRPPVRALVVFGWQPLVVAGPGSYADDLLRIVGGENAAAELRGPFPSVPAERALGLAAERIVDATFGYEARLEIPGWEGRLVSARSQALARPGPRVVEALEDLLRLLHGDRTTSAVPEKEESP